VSDELLWTVLRACIIHSSVTLCFILHLPVPIWQWDTRHLTYVICTWRDWTKYLTHFTTAAHHWTSGRPAAPASGELSPFVIVHPTGGLNSSSSKTTHPLLVGPKGGAGQARSDEEAHGFEREIEFYGSNPWSWCWWCSAMMECNGIYPFGSRRLYFTDSLNCQCTMIDLYAFCSSMHDFTFVYHVHAAYGASRGMQLIPRACILFWFDWQRHVWAFGASQYLTIDEWPWASRSLT